ncbi:MAG: Dna2/Cas4 domain-containing protein [Methanolinea sp.]|jgi:CRISPR-associated exonuclease Cas4|nr:Dna2/Cas4 domain-containing protein [Methanolinea sp.]
MNEKKRKYNQTVPVSSVITASLCPMRLYLEARSGEPRTESPRYTICKQVSSHLGSQLDPVEIWNEVTAILPDVDAGMQEFLETCIARCDEGGPWAAFSDTDIHLHSEKYGLSGNLDKVHEDEPYLSIVRTVQAPRSGVYSSDRLRVCGYMILLNEEMGGDVRSGAVEYIPSGVTRTCSPQPIDKRRFLKALNDARSILSGDAPPRPGGHRCQACDSFEACRPSGRRLSDIL